MKFSKNGSAIVSVIGALTLGGLLMAGCESGGSGSGGGGGPAGNSTIQGTVASFSSGSAFFIPAESRGLIARALDLFVPDALAAQANVNVRIRKTDMEATTDSAGYFIISGVPAGTHVLDFTLGSATAPITLIVPDNSTITLNGIKVANETVSPGSIETVVHKSNASP